MTQERILVGDQWYVAATSARTEEREHVLKHDESFALFDRFGDVAALGGGDEGLFHEDTRHLSHQLLRIEGARPLYLGSRVKDDNSLLVVELMNPDLGDAGQVRVPKSTLHMLRAKLLWRGACQEHLRLTNHGGDRVETQLSMSFDADFADLFELRGMQRARHGQRLAPQVGADEVVLGYRGLDGALRRTRLHFEPAPTRLDAAGAEFRVVLAPGEEVHLYLTTRCERLGVGTAGADAATNEPTTRYEVALRETLQSHAAARSTQCEIETSNPQVNRWLDRSWSDLVMLTTALPTGPYPYAGVPWYSTTFGRDGILTAREMLWVDPALARGVLAFLAATQATRREPQRDAEPGKILHEARRGEMAETGEIPFGRYYGSVDSTPLFIALAGAYLQRSGDLAFIRELWPHLRAALQWIERDGDIDGDGFCEYARRSSDGLLQQGWKDSHDSVFHADGRMAEPPIALVEVQAYVFAARMAMATMARRLGDAALSGAQLRAAQTLRRQFRQAYWSESIGTYAIALDGAKRRCEVATSNAAHALWTGIAAPEHVPRIVAQLLDERFHNGFGVRTVAAGQARYNPMSYHNGSIWPHDNAIAAAGMARYGFTDAAVRVMSGLFDACLHFDQYRLPELFCGFARRAGEGPTLYPVACSPQAWASAAAFSLLRSCLGLSIDADARRIELHAPKLPDFVQWVGIRQLPVGEHRVDLLLQRYQRNVGVEVTRNDGGIGVSVSL